MFTFAASNRCVPPVSARRRGGPRLRLIYEKLPMNTTDLPPATPPSKQRLRGGAPCRRRLQRRPGGVLHRILRGGASRVPRHGRRLLRRGGGTPDAWRGAASQHAPRHRRREAHGRALRLAAGRPQGGAARRTLPRPAQSEQLKAFSLSQMAKAELAPALAWREKVR